MAKKKGGYISGHYTYSPKAREVFGDRWACLTLLREPTDRWFSHYFYDRYKTSKHFKHDEPLAAFADSPSGEQFGWNYVKYLTGAHVQSREDALENVEHAVTVLGTFQVVGVLEKIDVFAKDCLAALGVEIPVQHLNKNPRSAKEQGDELTDEVMKQVQYLCEPNARVYRAVVERLNQHGTWLTS